MLMAKWLLAGTFILIAAEVAAFTLVGSGIGFLQAFGLLAATSLLGLVVLRYPGRARLDRLRGAVTQHGIVGLEAGGDAFLTVSAGILLLLPGFISDGLGLLLLVPAVRRWIGGRFRRFAQSRAAGRPSVVDLDSEDWRRVPDRTLDDQRRRNDHF